MLGRFLERAKEVCNSCSQIPRPVEQLEAVCPLYDVARPFSIAWRCVGGQDGCIRSRYIGATEGDTPRPLFCPIKKGRMLKANPR